MNPDTYTQSLEQLLVFMCQTYTETQKALFDLYKADGNEAAFKVPMIQGTDHAIGISRLSDFPFEAPAQGFTDVAKCIQDRKERLL